MSYPSLPFALVHFLATHSAERSSLDPSVPCITLVAHHDKSARARRIQILSDADWQQVIPTSAVMIAEDPVDTFAIIFSASDGSGVDGGVLIEGGRAPMAFTWTFKPAFLMSLIVEDQSRNSLIRSIGVSEVQSLLDRMARPAALHDDQHRDKTSFVSKDFTVIAPDGTPLS